MLLCYRHLYSYVAICTCVRACVCACVCVCVATIPYTYNHHYHHHSVIKVTIYTCIQYMRHCSRKRPLPPSHSATYNITFTTCMYIQPPPSPQHSYATMHAFSICTTALGKSPPAPPSHSASYNITSNHHYHYSHHHDHHSTNYNACIQYMHHCFKKKTTTTAITQCKLQYCVKPPLPLQPPPPPPPQHNLQCMHSLYAPLL